MIWWRIALAIGLSAILVTAMLAQETIDSVKIGSTRFTDSETRLSMIDPDLPALQISRFGGRWRNKVGTSIELFSVNFSSVTAEFCLEPFVEIHDFNRKNDFSWELWRGSLGVNMFWIYHMKDFNFYYLPKKLIVELGYYHESEHASSAGFTDEFTNYFVFESFPNGTFGSFEYVKGKINFVHTVNNNAQFFQWSLGGKYFPLPIEPGAGRKLRRAFWADFLFKNMLSNKMSVYLGGYYEAISTEFVASESNFKTDFVNGTLHYRILELGIEYTMPGGSRLMPFVSYSNSSGRGLDFLRNYDDLGWGIKVAL